MSFRLKLDDNFIVKRFGDFMIYKADLFEEGGLYAQEIDEERNLYISMCKKSFINTLEKEPKTIKLEYEAHKSSK